MAARTVQIRDRPPAPSRVIVLLLPGVHALETLAEVAAVSPRHLTRIFRGATGVTLTRFAQKVKLEVARSLVENESLGLEAIAGRCGFEDARQLRRLWKQHNGSTLSSLRRERRRRLLAS